MKMSEVPQFSGYMSCQIWTNEHSGEMGGTCDSFPWCWQDHAFARYMHGAGCASLCTERETKWTQEVVLAALCIKMGMQEDVYRRTHSDPWYLSVGSQHCQTVQECLNTNKLCFPWMESRLQCAITGCVHGGFKVEWVFHFSLTRFSSPLGTHDAVNNSSQMPKDVPASSQQMAVPTADLIPSHAALSWPVWLVSSTNLIFEIHKEAVSFISVLSNIIK